MLCIKYSTTKKLVIIHDTVIILLLPVHSDRLAACIAVTTLACSNHADVLTIYACRSMSRLAVTPMRTSLLRYVYTRVMHQQSDTNHDSNVVAQLHINIMLDINILCGLSAFRSITVNFIFFYSTIQRH